MKDRWKTGVIFILAIALTAVIFRGYESRYVESLVIRNIELEQLKLRTEQFVEQNIGGSGQQVFRQLGYEIVVIPPDTTGESEDSK